MPVDERFAPLAGDPRQAVAGAEEGSSDRSVGVRVAPLVDDREHPFAKHLTNSMGLSLLDLGTGGFGLYVSNMYSHAGNRLIPQATGLSDAMRANLLASAQGNQLFERRGGAWVETAVERGIDQAGWAWGSAVFDLENDGDEDLYVVNGYTSHSDGGAPDY